MDVTSQENRNSQIDQYPLLVERMECHSEREHIIDIARNDDASSSSSHDYQHPQIDSHQHDDTPSGGRQGSNHQSPLSLNGSNSRNSTFTGRGDGRGQWHTSPLNTGLWISIELLVNLAQIIASVIVLSMSRDENPEAPLFAWVVGYTSGCLAMLPILYWRFHTRNQRTQQDPSQSREVPPPGNFRESTSYTAISDSQTTEEENVHSNESFAGQIQNSGAQSARMNNIVDHFKMILDCFFAVWFVVGNVWIFGGHSDPADAPKLYRLCIVFLTFSCIGYAMPFILCATICCCLPCIISILGVREEFSQIRGATEEFINTLPTYKFKVNSSGKAEDLHNPEAGGSGGVLAAGTVKEREISAEDAVCCICLSKYVDDEELRELPCLHIFHIQCVDKWLKINASCPLCKCAVGEESSPVAATESTSQ